MLAILAMLTPYGGCAWLRVAPRGGSGYASAPFPSAPRGSVPDGMVGTEEWVWLIEHRNGV